MVNLAPGETIDVEYEAVNVGDVDSTQTLELTTQDGSGATVVDSVSQTFTVGQTGTGTLSWTTPQSSDVWQLKLSVEGENSLDSIDVGLDTEFIPSDLVLGQGAGDGVVYSINRADGSENWTFDDNGNGVYAQSSAALTNDTIYFPTRVTTLYAFDRETGSVDWTFDVGDSLDRVRQPLLYDGSVYVCNEADGEVFSIDASDGSQNWKTTVGGDVAAAISVFGNNLYVPVDFDALYSLDRLTGSQNWTYPSSTSRFTTAIEYNGFVFIGTNDGEMLKLDTQDGTEDWVYNTGEGAVSITPVVTDSSVFFNNSNGELVSVDRQSGTENWTSNVAFDFVTSSPVIIGDTIYTSTSGGDVVAADIADGSEIFDVNIATDLSSIAISKGILFVRDTIDDTVYAFDIDTENIVWTRQFDNLIFEDIGGSEGVARSNRPGVAGNINPIGPL